MNRITAYFLLFFVLFTHNTIAMDVHFPSISGHDSSMVSVVSDQQINPTLQTDDFQDCGDLSGHCSHSASHVSGIVSSISLPPPQIQRIFISVEKNSAFINTQAPPVRPPKA
jgi:hypothetical protein